MSVPQDDISEASALEALEAQRKEIEAKIKAAKEQLSSKRVGALSMIVKLMSQFDISVREVSAGLKEVARSAQAAKKLGTTNAKEKVKSPPERGRMRSKSGGPSKKKSQLRPVKSNPVASKGLLVPKYKDPESGRTWSGRGLQPAWFRDGLSQGKSPEFFLVNPKKK